MCIKGSMLSRMLKAFVYIIAFYPDHFPMRQETVKVVK